MVVDVCEHYIFFKKNEQNKEEIYFIKKAMLLLNTIRFYMKINIVEMVSFSCKYRIPHIFGRFLSLTDVEKLS